MALRILTIIVVVFSFIPVGRAEELNTDSILTVIKGLQANIDTLRRVARSQERNIAFMQNSVSVLTAMVKSQMELITISMRQLENGIHEIKDKQTKIADDVMKLSSDVALNKEKNVALDENVIRNTKQIQGVKDVATEINKNLEDAEKKIGDDIMKLSSDVALNKEKIVALDENVIRNTKQIQGVKDVATEINKNLQDEQKKIETNTNKIEDLSRSKCEKHSHCKTFASQCWCFVGENRRQGSACGYPSNYNGVYYSIVGTGQPRDLILKFGLTLHVDYCINEENCDMDCATNRCVRKGDKFHCFGTKLSCWNDIERWSRQSAGFVRCTNYE